MKGGISISRAAKAVTLLTIYLLSTVWPACAAIGCNCPHAFYHSHSKQCAAVCCQNHCEHSHSNSHSATVSHLAIGDRRTTAVNDDNECCRHNHSTETQLYTADSNEQSGLRTALTHHDATADTADTATALPTADAKSFAERRSPPPQKSEARTRTMRAPPVCA